MAPTAGARLRAGYPAAAAMPSRYPHNPNLSNGLDVRKRAQYASTEPIDGASDERGRAPQCAPRIPCVEMMQIQGLLASADNGMYNVLGGEDELCGFEKIAL